MSNYDCMRSVLDYCTDQTASKLNLLPMVVLLPKAADAWKRDIAADELGLDDEALEKRLQVA
ncbi:hypothetical protein diail_9828, partial [Diaporthe ilicicola]